MTTKPQSTTEEPINASGKSLFPETLTMVACDQCDKAQPWPLQCGHTYVGIHSREYTRISSASAAPSVVNFEAWTTIDQWLRQNPQATAAECLAELIKRIKIEAVEPASAAPVVGHHKHCSAWTVTTSGEKKPCDCVCECSHTMFEHIRPGEHSWYEDCAADGCPCMKFTAAAATAASVEQSATETAEQIVGTIFDNTGASHETLKRTMIERIAQYLEGAR